MDPTACKALKQVQRAEFGYRPLVYICSPYAGDIGTNTSSACVLPSRGGSAGDPDCTPLVVPAVHGEGEQAHVRRAQAWRELVADMADLSGKKGDAK